MTDRHSMPNDPCGEREPFEVVDFASLAPVACPCGWARRAWSETPDFPVTMHVTDIHETARTHYHRHLTEAYYILECEADAVMELNEQRLALRPGLCILIRPGTRHRAVGRVRALLVVSPKFDPSDEWFDLPPSPQELRNNSRDTTCT